MVAALSLAVALTVMVASFRQSVSSWLDAVLPAALYVRAASGPGPNDTATFSSAFVQAAAQLPGVQRLSAQRSLPLTLDPTRPAVTLLVRHMRDADDTHGGSASLPCWIRRCRCRQGAWASM